MKNTLSIIASSTLMIGMFVIAIPKTEASYYDSYYRGGRGYYQYSSPRYYEARRNYERRNYYYDRYYDGYSYGRRGSYYDYDYYLPHLYEYDYRSYDYRNRYSRRPTYYRYSSFYYY